MNIKRFLRETRAMNKAINAKKRHRESLYFMVTGKAITYDKDKIQSSTIGDKLERTLAEVADLDREITNDIRKLSEMQLKAVKYISSLSKPEYIAILTDYYLSGYTWERVADNVGYSKRQVLRYHGYALEELQKKIR